MSNSAGLMIEGLVAVLLVITIGLLHFFNRRLQRLKADEMSFKATISELITATEIAERAIAGLKVAVRECDQDLGERLRSAERFSTEIAHQLDAGQEVLNRLNAHRHRNASVARRAKCQIPKSMLVAAQAFAERARTRVTGYAA